QPGLLRISVDPLSSPWPATWCLGSGPFTRAPRLMIGLFGAREGLRVAKHLKTHGTCKWCHFNELHINCICKLVSSSCPLPKKSTGRLVKDIVVVAQRRNRDEPICAKLWQLDEKTRFGDARYSRNKGFFQSRIQMFGDETVDRRTLGCHCPSFSRRDQCSDLFKTRFFFIGDPVRTKPVCTNERPVHQEIG